MAELVPVSDTFKISGLTPIEAGSSGAPANFTAALASQGFINTANQILRSAARGTSPINGVLGVSPTFSQAATNANSTLNAAVAVATLTTNLAAGSFAANDTNYIQQIGGPLSVQANGYIGDTVINTLSPLARQGGHGMGIRFMMDQAAFEIGVQNAGSTAIVYMTDPQTRIRARVQAADQAIASGLSYSKWTFAAPAQMIIEAYPAPFCRLTNIVVGAGNRIWKAPNADGPRIVFVGDSWETAVSTDGGTNQVRLAMIDYFAERLGSPNINSASVSSTGLISGGNVATSGTYLQRIMAGDIDRARVGDFDGVICGGSLNDGGNTDAARQAAYTATIKAAGVAQPNALIYGHGPQYTTATPTAQSTYDAHKAGFAAAAATFSNDPRFIYLDNSPAGEGWLNSGNVAAYIGSGTNNHLNNAGMSYYGYRMALSLVGATRTAYGL